jgi:hypothetical protein
LLSLQYIENIMPHWPRFERQTISFALLQPLLPIAPMFNNRKDVTNKTTMISLFVNLVLFFMILFLTL